MEHSQTSAGGAGRRLRVVLVQQGVWDMPLESLPLASAYLKAMVSGDAELNDQVSVEICNFRGRVTHGEMAARLFAGPLPDVIGFSVFGWSQRAFGALAATYKQLNPQGWVIFGGTHVSAQAERVFRLYPEIDVVVNGEGELTFLDLLRARLADVAPDALGDVQGISWHRADGSVVTNPDRPRIEDLDIIPSPFLTGAVELLDADGRFRYDVALFETNRGCPYKCSFCYWGGAVGQRVRAFSRERLRAELELFARCGVHTVVACDANFGMLPIDLELVDDLIDIKRRHGFPLAFESSWAKNKSKVFYEIVRRMKEAGLRSSFTLALQSLNPDALTLMRRRNMKVNDWRDLVRWLNREGLDCYAELIWGAPGDTVESFLAGYDELAQHVSRIAVYPIMLLPNTEYAENKELYGIVALRGDNDDFEYVLAHRTMTFADNAVMQRFLFWARVMAENAVLRHCWLPLRRLAGWEQSRVLNSLADWADTTTAREAIPLREAAMRGHGGGAPAYAAAIGYLFTEADGRRALELWWQEVVSRQLAADVRPFLDEVYRYDLLTQPVCEPDGLAVVEIGGVEYFHRPDVTLAYDVPGVLARMRADEPVSLEPEPIRVDIYYRTGAMTAVMSTNHEEILHFMGEVRRAGTPLTVP